MGTTRSFYNILNKGFSYEVLLSKMKQFPSPANSKIKSENGREQPYFNKFFHELNQIQKNNAVIAFKNSATWLPFFKQSLCEGYIASREDVEKLSHIFSAPVLAFAIFDSDVLSLLYSDAEQNIFHCYTKPNYDFDTDWHSTGFPEFLLPFCKQDGLKEIWEFSGEVFADDRMHKICAVLQTQVLYNYDDIPKSYQAVFSE